VKTNDIFDVLGGIVFVTMITAIVSSRNSAGIVTASGKAFSGVLRASLGKQ
jgi:hypothetical protein